MTVVKICGIQRPQDAVAAAEAGADFVGLVFVPERRRMLSPEQAAQIVEALQQYSGNSPQVVGLFADQPIEQVNEYIESCPLQRVQLCGRESPEYCQRVQAPVIKVIHVPEGDAADDDGLQLAVRMRLYSQAGHALTLDRQLDGLQGGTGQSFDWGIAARLVGEGHQFLLAGGLTPDNVAEAIRKVAPWGVDVSSGVETKDAKDAGKIRAFVQQVRQGES